MQAAESEFRNGPPGEPTAEWPVHDKTVRHVGNRKVRHPPSAEINGRQGWAAKLLSKVQARRIAANIAKLPDLLRKP